jgi:F0F1-type ATP synthase membrane subunit a
MVVSVMERQQPRPTPLAYRVCVFAFLLNYCYSVFLALYAEPIIGLNTPAINVIYGLTMGLPLFVICGRVLITVRERRHSLAAGEGGNGSEPPDQRALE